MKRRIVIGVEFEGNEDRPAYRKLIASWNEHNEITYKHGALIAEAGSPIAERFSRTVQEFNRKEGTSFSLSRRIDIEYEKADIEHAEWLRLNVNGFAGAGSRELVNDTYEDSKCPSCGFRESRQLRPLVVLKREVKKRDFLHTSHLECLVSDRARAVLQEVSGADVTFRPIHFLGKSGSREVLTGFSQLECNTTGGAFSAAMTLDNGKRCETCGREESRTTGGAPLLVKRESLPAASMFRLDEGLGSSCMIPSRSRPIIITRELSRKLRKHRLSGFAMQPLFAE